MTTDDPTLDAILNDLRHPLVDVRESEQALLSYIRAKNAIAFADGAHDARIADADGEDLVNPYGDPEGCTCGYGGVHEPLNPRCAQNRWLADQHTNR